MLIRGGENIFPREVEEFLIAIRKVQDAQVFGVPDQRIRRGSLRVDRAEARPVGDEEEIRDFCRGQIAHYKVPRYVRFVAELPKTATGKAQKFVMREAMMRELSVREARTA